MLNKTDIYNLLILLQRVTLQGAEVKAYNQIVSKLEIMMNNISEEVKEVQEE